MKEPIYFGLIFVQFANIVSKNCLHWKYPSILWVGNQIYVYKIVFSYQSRKTHQIFTFQKSSEQFYF